MPGRVLAEWMEYERIEPFGSWRDNYHSAIIASLMANAFSSERSRRISPDEFFYRDPESAQEYRDNQMLNRFRALKKKDGN